MNTQVRIIVCREEDVDRLELRIPSPGENRLHARRFGRQQEGLSTYLVAWLNDVPVGSGEIRWGGCAAAEVQAAYPGCPEVNGLSVWPPELRSQGIGTALLRAAEQRVREHGDALIGLGVNDDNPAAAALYLRLGYQETGCHYLDRYDYLDADGARHQAADPSRFLVKPVDGGTTMT
ncbi:GNAT family N-acetyltransferase [Actinoallomurus oryzae]|uniref:GNAT family N-acetyltransferase n=1 Tax=Actinoallomurus oryzae TaxID=502180 RepID=UPI0031EB9248